MLRSLPSLNDAELREPYMPNPDCPAVSLRPDIEDGAAGPVPNCPARDDVCRLPVIESPLLRMLLEGGSGLPDGHASALTVEAGVADP